MIPIHEADLSVTMDDEMMMSTVLEVPELPDVMMLVVAEMPYELILEYVVEAVISRGRG